MFVGTNLKPFGGFLLFVMKSVLVPGFHQNFYFVSKVFGPRNVNNCSGWNGNYDATRGWRVYMLVASVLHYMCPSSREVYMVKTYNPIALYDNSVWWSEGFLSNMSAWS